MTVVRKKSEVPELNQAKLGLVKLRQGCWSNFQIVVRSDQLTNLSFRSVSVTKIQQIKIKIQNAQIFEIMLNRFCLQVCWFMIEHNLCNSKELLEPSNGKIMKHPIDISKIQLRYSSMRNQNVQCGRICQNNVFLSDYFLT